MFKRITAYTVILYIILFVNRKRVCINKIPSVNRCHNLIYFLNNADTFLFIAYLLCIQCHRINLEEHLCVI